MFTKFASLEVLDVKGAATQQRSASLSKFADYDDYRTDDGYVYVRVRAISSRVNKNHDGWPSEELKKSYRSFIGKPIFVDHHNSDPKKARGVIVDAALHIEDTKKSALDPYYSNAPENHLPPTWVELLLEVDAKRFPKLARAIIDGDIDGVSMGANVEMSKCSHCGNEAYAPEQYCKHVQSKGAYFDYHDALGKKTSKMAYEDCYDIGFFEISFVFDPADETALVSDIKHAKAQRIAAIYAEGMNGDPNDSMPDPDRPSEDYNDYRAPSQNWRETEPQRVVEWRMKQFQSMFPAYSPEQILALANSNLDWHDFDNVINRGATPDQAMAIVSAAGIPPAPGLEYYTPDEVCETLPGISHATGLHLWDLTQELDQTGQGVPMGGDRHDPHGEFGPPTVETPGDRNDFLGEGSTGSVVAVWDRLSPQEQQEINAAYAQQQQEYGNFNAKVAQNPVPQNEMTTAPDKVDTLRQEQVCPICGSDMDDGVCEVCNYEEPPEGFDNPDLSKAKEVDEQLHQQDAEQAAQGQQNAPSDITPAPGNGPQPMPSGAMPGAPGPTVSSTGKNRASHTVSIDKTSAAQGGRINPQERPILPVTRKLSDRPIDPKVITKATRPVLSTQKDKMTQTLKTADGATAQGEGVQADKRVDVEGVGAVSGDPLSGIDHENVEKDTGDFTAPHTDTWSGNEGDSLGQHEPVTNETGDLFTVAQVTAADAEDNAGDDIGDGGGSAQTGGSTWDSGKAGFPDHQPSRVDLLAPLTEEVGEGTSTDSSEEFRSLKHTEPVTKGENANSLGGPIGVAISKAKAVQMKAFRLAETEIDLGITEADDKYDRVAALEEHSEEALDALGETLARVKTAGLRKHAATPKTSATRMPSFAKHASLDIEAHSVSDSVIEDVIGW